MVQTLQMFVEVPQSQFLPGCGRRRDYAATSCLATVKVPQIQFIAGVSVDIPVATETGTHSCSCAWRALFGQHGGGDEAVVCSSFEAFSASVHLDVEAQGGGDAGV